MHWEAKFMWFALGQYLLNCSGLELNCIISEVCLQLIKEILPICHTTSICYQDWIFLNPCFLFYRLRIIICNIRDKFKQLLVLAQFYIWQFETKVYFLQPLNTCKLFWIATTQLALTHILHYKDTLKQHWQEALIVNFHETKRKIKNTYTLLFTYTLYSLNRSLSF